MVSYGIAHGHTRTVIPSPSLKYFGFCHLVGGSPQVCVADGDRELWKCPRGCPTSWECEQSKHCFTPVGSCLLAPQRCPSSPLGYPLLPGLTDHSGTQVRGWAGYATVASLGNRDPVGKVCLREGFLEKVVSHLWSAMALHTAIPAQSYLHHL